MDSRSGPSTSIRSYLLQLALSLNLLLGYAGQVSVAHAAFGAVGGYTVGYMTINHGWDFVPAALFGMVARVRVGVLVSLPAMKLSVEYLILLTLAVSSVIIGVFTTITTSAARTASSASRASPSSAGTWSTRRLGDTVPRRHHRVRLCWRHR